MTTFQSAEAKESRNSSQSEARHDVAYKYIKSRILNMSYKPGETLSEVEISKELGISRTPVRDALRRLTTEGLVQWTPNKGRVVYTLSLHDIEEIFDIKEALETRVAGEVARKRNDKDLGQLSSSIEGMEAAARAGNLEAWFENDRMFHETLYNVAGNQRVRQIVENLNEQWYRLRSGFLTLEGRMLKSVKEHRLITEAVSRGDVEAAEVYTREHIRNVRNSLINVIENFVVPYVGENI